MSCKEVTQRFILSALCFNPAKEAPWQLYVKRLFGTWFWMSTKSDAHKGPSFRRVLPVKHAKTKPLQETEQCPHKEQITCRPMTIRSLVWVIHFHTGVGVLILLVPASPHSFSFSAPTKKGRKANTDCSRNSKIGLSKGAKSGSLVTDPKVKPFASSHWPGWIS